MPKVFIENNDVHVYLMKSEIKELRDFRGKRYFQGNVFRENNCVAKYFINYTIQNNLPEFVNNLLNIEPNSNLEKNTMLFLKLNDNAFGKLEKFGKFKVFKDRDFYVHCSDF